jgi:hypothetical protein
MSRIETRGEGKTKPEKLYIEWATGRSATGTDVVVGTDLYAGEVVVQDGSERQSKCKRGLGFRGNREKCNGEDCGCGQGIYTLAKW